MIDMELLSVIRRWHHREHMPIREIERRTGLSRNTIRKYLRSNTVEVRLKVPERPSRLDPYADKLAEWLRVEAGIRSPVGWVWRIVGDSRPRQAACRSQNRL